MRSVGIVAVLHQLDPSQEGISTIPCHRVPDSDDLEIIRVIYKGAEREHFRVF